MWMPEPRSSQQNSALKEDELCYSLNLSAAQLHHKSFNFLMQSLHKCNYSELRSAVKWSQIPRLTVTSPISSPSNADSYKPNRSAHCKTTNQCQSYEAAARTMSLGITSKLEKISVRDFRQLHSRTSWLQSQSVLSFGSFLWFNHCRSASVLVSAQLTMRERELMEFK